MEWRKEEKYRNKNVSPRTHNKREQSSAEPRGEGRRRQTIKHGNIVGSRGTTVMRLRLTTMG